MIPDCTCGHAYGRHIDEDGACMSCPCREYVGRDWGSHCGAAPGDYPRGMNEMTAAEAIGYARDWIVKYGTESSHVAQVFVALLDHSVDLAARLDRVEANALEVARQAYLKEATA